MDEDNLGIFSFIDMMSALSLAFLIIIFVLAISFFDLREKSENYAKEIQTYRQKLKDIPNLPKKIIIPNELNGKVFFDKGKYNIKREFIPILNSYVDTLKKYLSNTNFNSVQIAGHTDTDRLINSKIKDNWDLGALRATEVTRYFINHGLNPEYFSATSFAEHQPLKIGDTEDSKKYNRRIEIIMQKITNQ